MSDRVSTLIEAVAECPICGDEFDNTTKLPRRMPCCEQPLCDICLETYIAGRKTIACPLCRVDVNLPGGVESLPRDMTVLRFLEVLKTRRDAALSLVEDTALKRSTGKYAGTTGRINIVAVPMCTACCQDKAIATCCTRGVYFWEMCSNAHVRNRSTRNHMISVFEHIQATKSIRPQGKSRIKARRVDASDIKSKLDKIKLRINNLYGKEKNINKSQKRATEQINMLFDRMMGELQRRRGILLSNVGTKADKERKSIRRALESHRCLQDKLKSSSSGQSAASLLQERPEDVEAERIGVTFSESNMKQLLTSIRLLGQVRLVTFTPTKSPSNVPEDEDYNIVRFSPDDLPEGPHLEFDHNTASADVQISSGVVSNIASNPAPHDTGCRFQSERRALTLQPLPLKRGQVVVFSTRVVFTVKQEAEEGTRILETTVTGE